MSIKIIKMHNLFEEEKKPWFEIEQVCMECGQYFIADYAYNSVCHSCRFKHITKKEEENDVDGTV